MAKIAEFLRESKTELKKVTWPTKQETVRHTINVIVISIAVAIFLGALDFGFQFILNKFIL